MNKWWTVAAAVLIGWVVVSMYFLSTGTPLSIPPWLGPYVPYIGVALFAVAIFASYRRPVGTPASPYALPAAITGAVLALLAGLTLINWNGGSPEGVRWLLGTIAWAPIAIALFVMWRRSLKR